MIIIADSGSTQTDWVILKDEQQIGFSTQGINPLFLDNKSVINDIETHFPKDIDVKLIEQVYFYGPGCGTKERRQLVESPLKSIFPNANIQVETDLLGAARALFQKGIACILGTGSNSGYYDGDNMHEQTHSLGYILGDEGSGANLGLQLIKHFLNHRLEERTEELFLKEYQLSAEQIIDKVYRQPYPNRFLASFAPFVNSNLDDKNIRRFTEQSFSDFIDLHILPYPKEQRKSVAFVGSVAYYFKDLLEELALKKGLKISKIVKSPINDLAGYYIN